MHDSFFVFGDQLGSFFRLLSILTAVQSRVEKIQNRFRQSHTHFFWIEICMRPILAVVSK